MALAPAVVAGVGASPGTDLVEGIPQRGHDGDAFKAILDEALGC